MFDLPLAICDTYAEQQDDGRPWANPSDTDLQTLEDRYPGIRGVFCELQGRRDEFDMRVPRSDHQEIVDQLEDAERDLHNIRCLVDEIHKSLLYGIEGGDDLVGLEDGVRNALDKIKEADVWGAY